MGKQSGLGDGLIVGRFDVSGDTQSLGAVGGGPALWEATAIDKSAIERIGLSRDGRMEITTFFNKADDCAHEAWSSMPLADRIVTYQRGRQLGSSAACMVAKQGDYAPERGEDGALTIKVNAVANGYGLTWCRQLTAGTRTDTEATDGDAVDLGSGPVSFGAVAFLHVLSFTGTDIDIVVEHSSDDDVTDAYTELLSFTGLTGAGEYRAATGATTPVKRYLRAATDTTGGFTSVTFALAVARHPVAVTY